MSGKISVQVTIEGLSEFRKLSVFLPPDGKLRDLFPALVQQHGPEVEPHLYNAGTGLLGVYMVILNSKLIRLESQLDLQLANGDEIFVISPLGGG